MAVHSGRHFLQIPGPTNVPDRVLRAMDMPTLDHRGPEFAELGLNVLAGSQRIFKTKQPVIVYPASGSGAQEAALVNTLSPGDTVLAFDIGEFSKNWAEMADITVRSLQQIYLGQTTPEAGMKDAEKQVDDILTRN